MARIRILFMLLALSAGVAYASDWQYAGYADEGKTGVHQFFDAESVTHPTKDTTRVWVKAIRDRDINRYQKSHEKLLVERSARKIAAGYSPKFLLLPAVSASLPDATALLDVRIHIITLEVMANALDIQAARRYYFEIDCVGKRIKLLEGMLYNDNGTLLNRAGPPRGDYEFIAPDTYGETLSRLVCTSK